MVRRGRQEGTREMVELVLLGREHGYRKLDGAIRLALELGCSGATAVRHLLTTGGQAGEGGNTKLPVAELGELSRYERPQPAMHEHDQLLLSLPREVIQ